jgi:opacity protein-like surface antigen
MKWNYSSIAALLLAYTASNFAYSASEGSSTSRGNWFISLGGGVQHPRWHNPMKVSNGSIFSKPYNIDLYSTKNQNEGILALYAGRRWERGSLWFPAYSFGLFWQYFFRTHLGKSITLDSHPALTHYEYDWDLTANLLLASAKLNLFRHGILSPFINGGIGSSFNRTSDYKEKALANLIPRVSPRFTKFSTSEFAYQLGVGIDLHLTSHILISVGYNYQDLGQISSGPGKGKWSTQSLNPGSYHSNEVLVSISYLFENKTK